MEDASYVAEVPTPAAGIFIGDTSGIGVAAVLLWHGLRSGSKRPEGNSNGVSLGAEWVEPDCSGAITTAEIAVISMTRQTDSARRIHGTSVLV
jgi:hypothetical protein